MKKLWKDNGGYALIYVLIVVLVLCAVAVSVCTAALKNYQAQEESVRQTRQLYQAEGEIEKFVALAEAVSNVSSRLTVSGTYVSEDAATEDAVKNKAKDAAKKKYEEYLADLVTDLVSSLASGYTLTLDTIHSDRESYKFTLTYKNDTVCIETEISMELTYAYDEETTTQTLSDGTTKEVKKYAAKVSKATHSYNTYTITHLTAEGETSG